MYKYRKSDGVEVGPVTGEELLELEKRGVITPSTLIIDGDSKIAYQVLKPLFANSIEQELKKTVTEPPFEKKLDNTNRGRETKWEDAPPRPWRRFFARAFDTWLSLAIFWYFVALSGLAPILFNVLGTISGPSQLLVAFALGTVPTMVLNSILIANTGTTFGKAIFGLRIRSANRGKISISQAMQRELLVLYFGLGLNVPVLNLIASAIRYQQLKKTGVTHWDTELETICLYNNRKYIPYSAIALVITFLIVKALVDLILKLAFPDLKAFL
ncbi:MAG: RDD family protein [Halieaceae bacterium]|nr:RDD family protein [Halieaceae bacterium]